LNGCNLSDIFEYMSPVDYEHLLSELVRAGAPGCRLVYWNLVVDRHTPVALRHALQPQRTLAERLHQQDKAFFYRDFVVEEIV
jgi:S-adenosylmethionine-diacylglycerol 3-amino-3-carboxypropyl transferase